MLDGLIVGWFDGLGRKPTINNYTIKQLSLVHNCKTMIKVTAVTVLIFFGTLSFGQSKGKDNTIDTGYAQVNNTKLYYEIAGKGEPVVLVHGSFGDRRFWDFQFFELAKKCKVLRYDIRGYGKSAKPDSTTVYRDAEDLKMLMDFLGIQKAHMVGLSLGSFIIIDFALAYPERCLSLVTVGPRVAGDAADEYRSAASDSLRAIIATTTTIVKTKGAKEATGYLWTGNHDMGRCITSPRTMEMMLKMGYEYSWWRYIYPSKREFLFPMAINRLNEIKMPTLVVTAQHDLQLCKEVAAILDKGIPNSRLISLKGAGHMANMDKPKEFNKAFSKFIRNGGKFTGTEIGL